MTEDSSRDAWLQQARSYLRNADPVLAWLIDDRPALASPPPMGLGRLGQSRDEIDSVD